MIMNRWLNLLAVCLCSTVASVDGEATYIVTFPETLRPGVTIPVQVDFLIGLKGSVQIQALLSNKNGSIAAQSSRLFPPKSKGGVLKIKVPLTLPQSTYTMNVSASGALSFSQYRRLSFSSKSLSVFIQTDKAIYKPGQTVHFRVVVTRPDLSIQFSPMDVEIFDPKGNKIMQWLNVKGTGGVFEDEMIMSTEPVLGDWKIRVTVKGQKQDKIFTVAEYILPKFEVDLELPPFAVSSDKFLSGKVKATYTFGKGVKGRGELKVWRSFHRPDEKPIYMEKFEIDGTYAFDISMEELNKTARLFNGIRLKIYAEVAEDLTDFKMNTSDFITIYNRREKLQFPSSLPDNFKPGLKYIAYLKLTDQADVPFAKDPGGQVFVRLIYYVPKPVGPVKPDTSEKRIALPPFPTDPQTPIPQPQMAFAVPENGIIEFDFTVPPEVMRVEIKAIYRGLEAYKNLERFQTKSNSHIQVRLLTKSPKTGSSATFEVRTTTDANAFFYVILSKGIIVEEGSKDIQNVVNLKVMMTSEMAPTSRIVVYAVNAASAEIVADAMVFSVEGIFENEVTVDYSKSKAKPGQKVDVELTADPFSKVCVLTVDKSVLLLKSGNDITASGVEKELESYGSRPGVFIPFEPFFRRFWWPIPAEDVQAVFREAGLEIITDALLYEAPRTPLFKPGIAMRKSAVAFEAPFAPPAKTPPTPPRSTNQRVRTKFPETWLFKQTATNAKGIASINAVVPDTITSWVASAFAVNNKTGLGVAQNTASLLVFLPFFISFQPPFSVIRGEQVILQANIFNFMNKDLKVKVTLAKSKDYESLFVVKKGRKKGQLVGKKKKVVRKITVRQGEAVPVLFPIVPVPRKFGNIDINIKAKAPQAQDAIRKPLLVEPEGVEREKNWPFLIILDPNENPGRRKRAADEESDLDAFPIDIPARVVPGSVRIRVTAIGDIMGPSINGLDNLLKMPYGCGEQNMLNFAPNIFVTKYLATVGKLSPAIAQKAKHFMVIGYQKELTFQHTDGSFSAFGNRDPSGSTWLTAFVVKSYAQASPYIFIDPAAMKKAIDWILAQYRPSTADFEEPGRVIHKAMQGGSISSSRTLAAFTLISLLEAKAANFDSSTPAKLKKAIDDVTAGLENAIPGMSVVFEMAITSYALQLAGSKKVKKLLNKLDNVAISSGGDKHWEVPSTQQTRPLAQDIEATAYVLLTYASREEIIESLPILKWIVKQRNPMGGFKSTQDTVVALQALAEIAALIYKPNIKVWITVTPIPFNPVEFHIDQTNADVLQSSELSPKTTKIRIHAKGIGMALVEIAAFYNIIEDFELPSFSLNITTSNEKYNSFQVTACFSWLLPGKSGMSVFELGVLSGFEADKFSVTDILTLKRVETGFRKLIMYFDEIDRNAVCVDVRMQRIDMVAKPQPAPATIFDYYDPSKQVTVLYQPKLAKEMTVCNLCSTCGCGK